MNLNELKKTIRANANKDHAKTMQWFFKTGKGEYGEGDKFVGIKVPVQRKIAKQFGELNLKDLEALLDSKIHEERLISLLILVEKYDKADEKVKEKIYRFYKKNTRKINNWDLVDLSAPKIMGRHLLNRDKQILYKFAHSKNLWEKRISIISTYSFIKNHDFNTTLEISDVLLNDDQDLIHKAVGWMLREVGKQDLNTLEKFLKPRYNKMPRTMLRYSIEKFPEKKRKKYLKGEIQNKMKKRENISSGAIWEDKVGYSRAVKVDDLIEISGTASVIGSEVVAVGDPYEQTKFIIEKFSSVLEEAGSSLKDIIRVRIYVREISHWEKVGKAFSEYFKNIKPAATLVEVSSLIDPQLLVEMEATAIITE